MRKVPYLIFLLLLASCSPSLDSFQPISDSNKRKIPSSYTIGDSLVYVYSDSVSIDTLTFVVQPYKDYLISKVIPEYDHANYYQIIEQELKPLDGSASLLLAFGTGYFFWQDFDSELFYFTFKSPRGYYYHLTSVKSSPDTIIYPFTSVYNPWPYDPDSVFVSYSTFTGIQQIQNINEGYQLKRIQ